jgi:guanylate kinase
MIVLVGESASGKSSIERYLMDNYRYKKIVSYTTRSPRLGEVDGIDYHFISVEEFKKLKEQGFFAETAVYNNWHYGTAKEDCTDDKIAVLTPHGLRQISKVNGITVTSFYINVPRRDRLIKILQRGDDIEEAYRRSLSDVGQFDGIEDEVNYVISNEGYKKSIKEMAEEIMKEIDFLKTIYY